MAFRSASTGTYTFASGSTGSTVDLGANNNYRYINATNVYNKGKSDGGGLPIPAGQFLIIGNGNSYGNIATYNSGSSYINGVYNKIILNCSDVTTVMFRTPDHNPPAIGCYIDKDGTITAGNIGTHRDVWEAFTVDKSHDYYAYGTVSWGGRSWSYFIV